MTWRALDQSLSGGLGRIKDAAIAVGSTRSLLRAVLAAGLNVIGINLQCGGGEANLNAVDYSRPHLLGLANEVRDGVLHLDEALLRVVPGLVLCWVVPKFGRRSKVHSWAHVSHLLWGEGRGGVRGLCLVAR